MGRRSAAREEAGYEASEFLPLGRIWSTVGFCDEQIHLFLGRGLVAAEQQLEPDEFIDLCPMTLELALKKVDSGEIMDSKTCMALFQYQRHNLESAR